MTVAAIASLTLLLLLPQAPVLLLHIHCCSSCAAAFIHVSLAELLTRDEDEEPKLPSSGLTPQLRGNVL
jgi:hypothetical protein